jgi:hypothetical protein
VAQWVKQLAQHISFIGRHLVTRKALTFLYVYASHLKKLAFAFVLPDMKHLAKPGILYLIKEMFVF